MEPITILKVIQQNAHHFLLMLSNGQEVTVHEDILVRYRLLAGKELDPQVLQELDYEGEVQRGYSQAIHYISYRPRATLEVKEYLKRKEIAHVYIEDIIQRLHDKGYLNDAEFAQKWVNNRQLLKPKSKLALRAELSDKGISSEIIQEILSTIDDEVERDQALEIGRKKMRQWRGKEWHEIRPKILRYLTYKGYKMDAILKILPKLEAEFTELA